MSRPFLSTHEKAFKINLDRGTYGAFAEIGAGQEVARWFFRVGGASGTVAKTISAYDMTVSDAIYGASDRYVSRQRLHGMLVYEYDLQAGRLATQRGASTRFFVFADTVAARSYSRHEDWHGWMGVRFQTRPLAEPCEIIIHVRMHDRENVQQQEALGIMGVNLVYAALHLHADPGELLASLLDNLGSDRVEVDMVRFAGPDFAGVDNRLMALGLVQRGLTSAAMFQADGEVVQAAEVLYKKPILVARGRFRPVTRAAVDLLERGRQAFLRDEPGVPREHLVTVLEITLKNLAQGGVIDPQDFLDRVDVIGALGHPVLVSDYGEFHRLAAYLFAHSRQPIAIVMGAPTLHELFEEHYYADLDGGILESFGRLFKNDLRLYVYPYQRPDTDPVLTLDTVEVAPHLIHLMRYLRENGFIRPLREYDAGCLPLYSDVVLERLQAGDPSWEQMVPPAVGRLIKERRFFGYRPE
ncbi:MAG: TonB-dependent receptor [Verrucomicrobiales bacterium]|nr:TonB-dependent receptor [Verrucomicrobiales bacterium]